MASPSQRRIAPAEHGQPFLARDAFDDAFAHQPLLRLHRQEHHADAVLPGSGSEKPSSRAFPREKFVRDLDQNAGAVAGFRIAAAGAAVRQIDQDLDALANDLVRFVAIEIDDKTHAAGVVLVAGIVETLRVTGGEDMLQNTLVAIITSTGFIVLQY